MGSIRGTSSFTVCLFIFPATVSSLLILFAFSVRMVNFAKTLDESSDGNGANMKNLYSLLEFKNLSC